MGKTIITLIKTIKPINPKKFVISQSEIKGVLLQAEIIPNEPGTGNAV